MRKPRRDRKQQRIDREQHYDEMERDKPAAGAARAFIRKAYSVDGYMAMKEHDVKKGLR